MDHPRPGLKYVDANDLDRSAFDFAGIDVVDPAGEKLGSVDGFIIDVNERRPYHVVVEAGHWYKHRHFLLPIGHARLDAGAKRLAADVAKARVERFPGFSRREFEKLSDADIQRMAAEAAMCFAETPVATTAWYTWEHFEYPTWWHASYYQPDRIADRDKAGVTSPQSSAADRGRR